MDASILWELTGQRESLLTLLQDAGLVDTSVHEEQLGYHLRDAQEWWEVLWNSALRLLVEQLPAVKRDGLRIEHLAEATALATVDGVRLNVPVLFARGHKPRAV